MNLVVFIIADLSNLVLQSVMYSEFTADLSNLLLQSVMDSESWSVLGGGILKCKSFVHQMRSVLPTLENEA